MERCPPLAHFLNTDLTEISHPHGCICVYSLEPVSPPPPPGRARVECADIKCLAPLELKRTPEQCCPLCKGPFEMDNSYDSPFLVEPHAQGDTEERAEDTHWEMAGCVRCCVCVLQRTRTASTCGASPCRGASRRMDSRPSSRKGSVCTEESHDAPTIYREECVWSCLF